jgi:hypothetical protein
MKNGFPFGSDWGQNDNSHPLSYTQKKIFPLPKRRDERRKQKKEKKRKSPPITPYKEKKRKKRKEERREQRRNNHPHTYLGGNRLDMITSRLPLT